MNKLHGLKSISYNEGLRDSMMIYYRSSYFILIHSIEKTHLAAMRIANKDTQFSIKVLTLF